MTMGQRDADAKPESADAPENKVESKPEAREEPKAEKRLAENS